MFLNFLELFECRRGYTYIWLLIVTSFASLTSNHRLQKNKQFEEKKYLDADENNLKIHKRLNLNKQVNTLHFLFYIIYTLIPALYKLNILLFV